MDYKKLFNAKSEGKISDDMSIIFDNDGGYWEYAGTELTEKQQEKLCNQYEKLYGSPDGYIDVVDIMRAAGFNADWC